MPDYLENTLVWEGPKGEPRELRIVTNGVDVGFENPGSLAVWFPVAGWFGVKAAIDELIELSEKKLQSPRFNLKETSNGKANE